MSQISAGFIPLGFVHTDTYDGRRDDGDEKSPTFREQLIDFINDELQEKRLNNDLELWDLEWRRRIEPQESGPGHRLALDWVGGRSRENGSHPDFPRTKYGCDVTAYPRPREEEQKDRERDPHKSKWANMRAGSSAYPDIPLYHPEIVKGRLLSVLGSTQRVRGPAPPWAVAIRQTVLDRAWRVVRNEPACPDEQSPMPTAIHETANSNAGPQKGFCTPEEAPIVERLAEFIFGKHPRNDGKPLSKKQLFDEAMKEESRKRWRHEDFDAAYKRVYDSKRGQPPVTGWDLREPYSSRLTEEKQKAGPEL